MAVVTPVCIIPSNCPRTVALILLLLLPPTNASPISRHLLGRSLDIGRFTAGRDSNSGDLSDSSSDASVMVESGKQLLAISELNKDKLIDSNVPNKNLITDILFSKCPKCSLENAVKTHPESTEVTPVASEEKTLRDLRLEMVKAQILAKLDLAAPPVGQRPQQLPDAVTEDFAPQDSSVEAAASLQQRRDATKIVVANERVACPPSSHRGSRCYSFQSQFPAVWGDAVSSQQEKTHVALYFWLPESKQTEHRKPHISVTRVVRSGFHRHHRHEVENLRQVLTSHTLLRSSKGWMHVNLTIPHLFSTQFNDSQVGDNRRASLGGFRTTSSSSSSSDGSFSNNIDRNTAGNYGQESDVAAPAFPGNNMILEIRCRHCGPHYEMDEGSPSEHQPFLVIQTSAPPPTNSRARRSATECSSSGGRASHSCCRESLYISFSELGWDDWIVQPPGFTLYYCKGSCSQPSVQDALSGGNTYESLLQRILLRDNLSPAVRAAVAPCCAAQQSEPLSIMWSHSPNSVRVDHLPNMVVTQCGCSG